jgi:predicted  nucleic acid-binding Zn-ribbon protein
VSALDDAIAAIQVLASAQDRLGALEEEKNTRQVRITELTPAIKDAQDEVTNAKAAAKTAVKVAFGL